MPAVEDMRQGGDPRLPLELALVKVTRPAADLSRESIAYRLEQLEQRVAVAPATAAARPDLPVPAAVPDAPGPAPVANPPTVELEQLQEAWQRTVLPAVEGKSIPAASVLREAHPAELRGDRLTVEFPATAAFHRQLAEEPKNATLLEDALYELTGRRLALEFAIGEHGVYDEADEPQPTEDEIYQLVKETFDARDLEE